MRRRIYGLVAAGLLLGCAAASPVAPKGYISEIAVTSSVLPGSNCPAGFTRVHGDLNAGAGGDYVYFCIGRSEIRSQAVNFLDLNERDREDPRCDEGDFKSAGGDLNGGVRHRTSRSFLYLCYTKVGSLPDGADQSSAFPIVDVAIQYDAATCAALPLRNRASSWRSLGAAADLNRGTTGKVVHLCYQVEDPHLVSVL